MIGSEHTVTKNIKSINVSFKDGDSDNLIKTDGKLQNELENMQSFKELDINSFIFSTGSSN